MILLLKGNTGLRFGQLLDTQGDKLPTLALKVLIAGAGVERVVWDQGHALPFLLGQNTGGFFVNSANAPPAKLAQRWGPCVIGRCQPIKPGAKLLMAQVGQGIRPSLVWLVTRRTGEPMAKPFREPDPKPKHPLGVLRGGWLAHGVGLLRFGVEA